MSGCIQRKKLDSSYNFNVYFLYQITYFIVDKSIPGTRRNYRTDFVSQRGNLLKDKFESKGKRVVGDRDSVRAICGRRMARKRGKGNVWDKDKRE